ncbi:MULTISPECIES: response regulator transcription factor [Aerococcus]|uniref:response regulator transcription factor n=1 Tax=Aerococcus TaxID=1375 RepID=UPI000DCE114F|nr:MULTISPECIES: response regulator transcription factor [Aerococcus]KAA9299062.1 response regulator transcription factor [Aerococcus tenax]MDK6688228.1 response regulator transcription factor [Aerococcus urinae]MDK8132653.1 response regulator transcription factor [Aerococcus urinae]MDK8484427.1 response regulator transcription factor [Aerococcus urinae]MDL5179290.1 response regulator transcription factor [Aerococcus tenax]
MKILMIEDNTSVAEMLSMFLDQEEGWESHFSYDGQEGYDYFKAHEDEIDIVILDLNLPSKDGISICQDIRKSNQDVIIIMLTARDSESDQVLGLGLGADDYITKPFSPLTLVAKMHALLRRRDANDNRESQDQEEKSLIKTKYLTIDTNTREASFHGQAIANLTPKEFDILALLASHPKQVFTRDHLLTSLWEDPFYGDERTVDAHIKKLRQKMEKNGPQAIRTVWGVGYKYDESGEK